MELAIYFLFSHLQTQGTSPPRKGEEAQLTLVFILLPVEIVMVLNCGLSHTALSSESLYFPGKSYLLFFFDFLNNIKGNAESRFRAQDSSFIFLVFLDSDIL
jgi:hypothetical protein